MSKPAFSIFHDCIISEAPASHLRLVDLGIIFVEDRDYATPTELSETGDEKLADTVL